MLPEVQQGIPHEYTVVGVTNRVKQTASIYERELGVYIVWQTIRLTLQKYPTSCWT
jgi:hypothetical protein